MEKQHRYDNTPFLSELEKRGFRVVSCSSSNYLATKFSIPSIVNMDYLDQFMTPIELQTSGEYRLKQIGIAHIFDNRMMDDLRPRG